MMIGNRSLGGLLWGFYVKAGLWAVTPDGMWVQAL